MVVHGRVLIDIKRESERERWQCRIYIPCSLSLRLLGYLRVSGYIWLDTKIVLKKRMRYCANSVRYQIQSQAPQRKQVTRWRMSETSIMVKFKVPFYQSVLPLCFKLKHEIAQLTMTPTKKLKLNWKRDCSFKYLTAWNKRTLFGFLENYIMNKIQFEPATRRIAYSLIMRFYVRTFPHHSPIAPLSNSFLWEFGLNTFNISQIKNLKIKL